MSNKRFIIFFILGSILLSLVLAWLSYRAKLVASEATRSVLCTIHHEKIDAFEIKYHNGQSFSLKKTDTGNWFIVSPFEAETDTSAVDRFIDVMTQTPLGDMLSDNEVGAIGSRLSDFGLYPPLLSVVLRSRGKTCSVKFGARTPSRQEVYARVNDLKNVFAVSAGVLSAIPETVDGFRRRAVLSCYPDEVSSIEFRAPGSPFVKLVNDGAGWQFVQPFAAVADVKAVDELMEKLAAAKIVSFVWTGAEKAADRLAGLGIDPDSGFSLAVRTSSGGVERIVFGGQAGTNLVYALVQNDSAVVTVDAELAELCKDSSTAFRDMRAFPVTENEAVKSLSLTSGASVYVLSRDSNHVWQLDAPVIAPADQVSAVRIVEKVLALKQGDLLPENAENAVGISIETSVTNFPGVKVSSGYFGPAESFADLRSKILVQLDIANVKRISVKMENDETTSTVYNRERDLWTLERSRFGRAVRINQAAVKKLLTALVRVDAVSVETLAASLDDIRRCGLDSPYYTIAVDLDSDDSIRKNILIGNTAPGGGRYATVGGMDAVFILPRATVAALTAPVTE